MAQLAHVSFVVFKYFCPLRVYTEYYQLWNNAFNSNQLIMWLIIISANNQVVEMWNNGVVIMVFTRDGTGQLFHDPTRRPVDRSKPNLPVKLSI